MESGERMGVGGFIRSVFESEPKEPVAPLFQNGAPSSPNGGNRRDTSRDDTVRIRETGGRPKKEKKCWFSRRQSQAPYVSGESDRPAPGAPVNGNRQTSRQVRTNGAARQNAGYNASGNRTRQPAAQNAGFTYGAGGSPGAKRPNQDEGADVFTGFGKKKNRRPEQAESRYGASVSQPASSGRIMNMNGNSVSNNTPIRIYTPKKMEDKAAGKKMHYGEYKRIIDDFVEGNIVMLNLANLATGTDDEKNKVLCLLFGAVAALDGYIYLVSDNMYLLARNDTDIAGAIKEGRAGAYMPGL